MVRCIFRLEAKRIKRVKTNKQKTYVDEGVHDGHGLGGDTGIRVHLFQHLVDVDFVSFGLQGIKCNEGYSASFVRKRCYRLVAQPSDVS